MLSDNYIHACTVQHEGASYVRLPNDGKDVFYYKATYTFTCFGSATSTDYFMWVAGDTSTQKAYFADYDLYYAYVTKGLMKGSVGTLK